MGNFHKKTNKPGVHLNVMRLSLSTKMFMENNSYICGTFLEDLALNLAHRFVVGVNCIRISAFETETQILTDFFESIK